MLNYIWLDDKSPILNQLPNGFNSAAILLHPFIQMPKDWEQNKRNNEYEHIYPSDEEILLLGKQVSWMSMMYDCGFTTFNEIAIALKTSIGAFKKQYIRDDLAEKLNTHIKKDCFYPNEDYTSVFLIQDLKIVLESRGAKYFCYFDPLLDNSGVLEIEKLTSLDIGDLALKELIITDENMDFAFMNVYDSFITVFMTRDEKIDEIVDRIGWEAIICDDKTYIDWYWSKLR
ncbi:hypothetical protein AN960_06275 [Bacillus sp. FJAT-25509]|uniref:DUF2711 family protein n=1 Tax=Bacillus sp. FJAT-25509 TaxID=1712029 RepID=UPI0006FB94DE|nr:DUF2711 family protein [Bacillus sp. FJAT-25509]KQL40820.1 hypothetical protein AN960_06275 [Bacillus sp. FJAT-25509]